MAPIVPARSPIAAILRHTFSGSFRCAASAISQPHSIRPFAMSWHTWLIYLLAAVGLSLTLGPNSLLALTHGALHKGS